MEKITFATMATPGRLARATLLFDSLRASGGELADAPCLLLIPGTGGALTGDEQSKLSALKVSYGTFDIAEEARRFPLATIVFVAAAAEERVQGSTRLLVWMVEDTLVINAPRVFLLPGAISYGYRPVHHTRIGSVYGEPPDAFWSLIYRHCGVAPSRIFPMATCTRDNTIRAYFNAGAQVVRPERHLLAAWRERFERLYRHPDFLPFYERDNLYRVFMHQAVLAGVVLERFAREEMLELPETINYPLHLHNEYPLRHRPRSLDELTTCRYEGIADLRRALELITVSPALKSRLNERLAVIQE